MGRPTKYETRFAKMAGKATALGATLDDLAELFDVEHSTIALWQTKHHAFSDAIKTARVDADATVERSLYQRALGYRAKTQKVVVANGSAEVVDYEEQHAPEVGSRIASPRNGATRSTLSTVATLILPAPLNRHASAKRRRSELGESGEKIAGS
jgi:hypothetical protein